MSEERPAATRPGGDKTMGTRGLSWGHEESLFLIELWSDETIQRDLELAPKSNRHLFDKIRKEIQKRVPGFDRTPEECRGRIKRLKRKYYETRKSGGYQLACQYYQELDAVLGAKPIPIGVFEKPHMRPPPPMGPVTLPGIVQERASPVDSKDNIKFGSYEGMDYQVNGGHDDSNPSRIGRAACGSFVGSNNSELLPSTRNIAGPFSIPSHYTFFRSFVCSFFPSAEKLATGVY